MIVVDGTTVDDLRDDFLIGFAKATFAAMLKINITMIAIAIFFRIEVLSSVFGKRLSFFRRNFAKSVRRKRGYALDGHELLSCCVTVDNLTFASVDRDDIGALKA